MGKNQISNTNNNIIKYVIMGSAGALTIAMLITAPLLYEAAGIAYTGFSAIMGAIIGGLVGKYFDHTPEGILAGMAVGSVLGVIMSKVNQSKNEDAGVDNKDYSKALDCTAKIVAHNVTKAIGCGHGNPLDCMHTYNGFDQITDCMGQDVGDFNTIYAA